MKKLLWLLGVIASVNTFANPPNINDIKCNILNKDSITAGIAIYKPGFDMYLGDCIDLKNNNKTTPWIGGGVNNRFIFQKDGNFVNYLYFDDGTIYSKIASNTANKDGVKLYFNEYNEFVMLKPNLLEQVWNSGTYNPNHSLDYRLVFNTGYYVEANVPIWWGGIQTNATGIDTILKAWIYQW